MIDLTNEEGLTLAVAARLPELKRNGKSPHLASLYRWCLYGVRGGIKLESWVIGGSRVTSRRAVGRFLAALSGEPVQQANLEGDAVDAEKQLAGAGF